MPFTVRNLSALAYANGFTLWHYKGMDAKLAAVLEPGFFQPADYMLAAGDMIMISASDGATAKGVCTDEAKITLQAL